MKFSIKIWQFILGCITAIVILWLCSRAPFSSESSILLLAAISAGAALYFVRKRFPFLNNRINKTFIILALILCIALFAPLISTYEPNAILNAGECKLLPPFSKKIVLFIKNDGFNANGLEKVVADSFKVKEKIVVYRKSRIIELDREKVVLEGSSPKIEKAFFILGTDELGRDLFSRVIYGARLSLTIGLAATFISVMIASFFAFISISRFRFIDLAVNRLSEIFLAIPSLFIIIFAISFMGNNLLSVILVLAATSWMTLFKILNGEIKRLINKNFIISSNMLGITKNNIFFKEIIPLILPSVIVNLVFQIANFIIIEASLSFLGLGPGGESVSWGSIIDSGITYMSDAWWLILFPGVSLFFTIIALNKTGTKLERLFNPLVR